MTTVGREEMVATNSESVDQRAIESGAIFQVADPDPGPVPIRALAVAAATKAGLYVPGEGTIEDAVSKCIVIDGLTEKILKLVIDDGGDPGLGTTVDYVDAIFDESGRQIGTSTSGAVVLCMTPHMWQFHRSKVELDDGSFETSGLLDVAAMTRSMTQILQVVGTGGRYDGKSGYLTIAIGDPNQKPPHYATAVVMC
jgi:hypothetical protein